MFRYIYLLVIPVMFVCGVSQQAYACEDADIFVAEETKGARSTRIILLNPCLNKNENHISEMNGEEPDFDHQNHELEDLKQPEGFTVPAEDSLFHFE